MCVGGAPRGAGAPTPSERGGTRAWPRRRPDRRRAQRTGATPAPASEFGPVVYTRDGGTGRRLSKRRRPALPAKAQSNPRARNTRRRNHRQVFGLVAVLLRSYSRSLPVRCSCTVLSRSLSLPLTAAGQFRIRTGFPLSMPEPVKRPAANRRQRHHGPGDSPGSSL